jgi:hypothetical protein
VSLLLGHSSVKITERHYAPFCKARQEQLAASVKLAWKSQASHCTAEKSERRALQRKNQRIGTNGFCGQSQDGIASGF